MKKFICILIVFATVLSGCSRWSVEIRNPEEQTGNCSSEVSSGTEKPEEIFYPSAGAYMEYGFEYIRGKAEWNGDNTLTFQHKNTITTISAENKILETVELPEEYLPEDGGYRLTWNENLVLAIDMQIEGSWRRFGVVYFTDDGGVHLANVSLFGRNGKLIRQYPSCKVYGYDENGDYEVYLPVPESTEIIGNYYIGDGDRVYWIGEDKAIFECHSRVVLYDFSKDEGKVLDDMSEFVEKHGKFGVYYGVQGSQCGVIGDSFYYLSYRDEENANSIGTIWRANENGAEELFGGMEFYHLFIGREILIAAGEVSGNFSKNGSIIYAIEPENPELKEIFRGKVSLPFGDDGKIRFRNYYNDDPQILYSYDYKTGELTEDIGNTEFSVQSIVPGYTDYVMKSPDGKYFVEYSKDSEEPRLRILPCE